MVDASTQYYYLDGARNQQGPVAAADIARLVRSGAILPETLIWFAGMPDWRPAGQINELGSLFGPAGAASMRSPLPPGGGAAMRQRGDFGAYERQSGGGYAGKSLGFGGAISTCLSKYTDFSGRAGRPEFWFWVLFQVLLTFAVGIAGGIIGAILPTLGSLFVTVGYLVVILGLLLPGLAVQVRRLHDTDRSGWWWFISVIPFGGIVLIVFWCLAGTPGPNRFGEVP